MISYEFGSKFEAELASLRAWAENPANVWDGKDDPPGTLDDRRRLMRVIEVNGMGMPRMITLGVIFTFTQQPKVGLCRQASLSITSERGVCAEVPSFNCCLFILQKLGFRCDSDGLYVFRHTEHAIVEFTEPIKEAPPCNGLH